jgi:hypothetical protein
MRTKNERFYQDFHNSTLSPTDLFKLCAILILLKWSMNQYNNERKVGIYIPGMKFYH